MGKRPLISDFSKQYHEKMFPGYESKEVQQDKEGLQIMRYLGRNLAWLLKLKEAGAQAGVPFPVQEERRAATNFIR